MVLLFVVFVVVVMVVVVPNQLNADQFTDLYDAKWSLIRE